MDTSIRTPISISTRPALARTGRASAAVGMLAWAVSLGACSGGQDASSRPPGSGSSASGASGAEAVAVVGSDTLTVADVRQSSAGSRLSNLEAEYRRERSQALVDATETLVRERLLRAEADRRGLTVDSLLEAEADGTLEVTQEDVEAWYERNRPRLGGRSLEQLRDQIEERLRSQQSSEVASDLVEELREGTEVQVLVDPYRVAFDNEDAPSQGPEGAPVTLVEFADFQCPYCGQFYPTFKLLKQNYGDQLRVVYRHYPIRNIHPRAWAAAEASMCAYEEGRFWEMHDMLFENQEELGTPALVRYAEEIGLDTEEFQSCLESDRHLDQIQADFEEGQAAGVSGTPALFVNGIQIPGGAVPYRQVADAIDEELTRVEG